MVSACIQLAIYLHQYCHPVWEGNNIIYSGPLKSLVLQKRTRSLSTSFIVLMNEPPRAIPRSLVHKSLVKWCLVRPYFHICHVIRYVKGGSHFGYEFRPASFKISVTQIRIIFHREKAVFPYSRASFDFVRLLSLSSISRHNRRSSKLILSW